MSFKSAVKGRGSDRWWEWRARSSPWPTRVLRATVPRALLAPCLPTQL